MNLFPLKNQKTRMTAICAFAAAAALAGVLAAPAQAGSDGKWKSGTEAYEKVCSRCHLTGVGPELRGRNLPPAYVKAIARNGLRAMPAFMDSALDDATLDRVAALVSASKLPAGVQPAAPKPSQKH